MPPMRTGVLRAKRPKSLAAARNFPCSASLIMTVGVSNLGKKFLTPGRMGSGTSVTQVRATGVVSTASSMTTIAVVVRYRVLAVLGDGGLDFIEPSAESSALHGVQSRQRQGHLQLRGRHSQVAAHDVVERHVVIGVGKTAGGVRRLGDHLGVVRRRIDHVE